MFNNFRSRDSSCQKRVKQSKTGSLIKGTKRWRPWRPQSDDPEAETPKTPESVPFNILSGVIAADIIPYFDPEKNDIGTEQWVNKIDQLGAVYNWTDNMKSYYMQLRLVGMAKVWHTSLQSYDMTWQQWKAELLQAFPIKVNFVELLREMLKRRKLPTESMAQYFYHKYSLLNRLEITGEKAVACMIDGLPHSMKASARAGNYDTPSDLYAKFVTMMPENTETTNLTSKEQSLYKCSALKKTNILICFLCHEPDHIARRCPRNNVHKPTCKVCGKNHLSANCWHRPKLNMTIKKPDNIGSVNVETGTQVNENQWKDEQTNL